MKLKKLARALNTSIRIANDDAGRQWIGDVSALYLMDERMEFNLDNILPILDIDKKKQDDYRVVDVGPVEYIGMEPVAGEKELKPMIQASMGGRAVVFLMDDEGETWAVYQEYIQPAEGDGPLTFTLRTVTDKISGGTYAPVVALYRGMFCVGVIAPLGEEQLKVYMEVMRKIVWEA